MVQIVNHLVKVLINITISIDQPLISTNWAIGKTSKTHHIMKAATAQKTVGLLGEILLTSMYFRS